MSLAHHFRRAGEPVQMARTPPLHPMSLIAQSLLYDPALRTVPMYFPDMMHRGDIASAAGLHQQIMGGQHQHLPQFLNAIRHSGLIAGEHADNVPRQIEEYHRMAGLPLNHPLMEAFTPGTFADRMARAAVHQGMRDPGTPWQLLSHGVHGNYLPMTHLDLNEMRPHLQDIGRSGGLWHIIQAMHRANQTMGARHGLAGPIGYIHRALSGPYDTSVNFRQQWPEMIGRIHRGSQDLHEMGMDIPETYYAGGSR